MLKASYTPYILHFKVPSGTSRGVLTQKETYFLKVWDEHNPDCFGIGECALFKGLGADDRPDYEAMLQTVCRGIDRIDEIDLSTWSSIRFGVETALLDLQHGGRRMIYPSEFTAGKQAIEINGLIWMGDKRTMASRIDEKLAAGFSCIKLKIGAIDFDDECVKLDEEPEEHGDLHRVEAVLGARFPGINKKLGDFNFKRHYGAEVKEIKRSGQSIAGNLENEYLREGDTLVVMADDSFIKTWGESSVFVLLANGKDTEPVPGKGKRWFALALLILMIVGATVGELPAVKEAFPEIKLDMFFFVSITTIIMAWTKIFPARKYTKYISWDILITIACAFAISKAMVNSGVADAVAHFIIGMSHHYGPHVLLAAMFIITNLFTELITNNAAAALAFPLALSISSQMGVSPMPFFVVICMAASASFSTPIGYQTNLIVQGIGNYKFTDFVRIGLPLNIITFLISIFLIPLIWPF